MAEILFNYKGIETIIQCNINDKIKDIINKFIIKKEYKYKKLLFFYNKDKINKELSFSQLANKIDIKRKKMNIEVYNDAENTNNIDINIIKSKDVICPECKENILINIKEYKINLNQCKNNHIKNNITLDEYEKIQKLDLSGIKCDKCNEKNINDIYTLIKDVIPKGKAPH